MSFPSRKRVTAILNSFAKDPSEVLRAVLCISVYSPALSRRAPGAPRTQPPARKTSPQAEGAGETTGWTRRFVSVARGPAEKDSLEDFKTSLAFIKPNTLYNLNRTGVVCSSGFYLQINTAMCFPKLGSPVNLFRYLDLNCIFLFVFLSFFKAVASLLLRDVIIKGLAKKPRVTGLVETRFETVQECLKLYVGLSQLTTPPGCLALWKPVQRWPFAVVCRGKPTWPRLVPGPKHSSPSILPRNTS